jgi:long-chain acyl-CoA synthetase
VEVKRRIIDVFPAGTVWELYGGTEALFTMVSPDEWLQKPGTVGRAGPGITLKILDDDGVELGPGDVGLIYASQPRFSYRAAHHKRPRSHGAATPSRSASWVTSTRTATCSSTIGRRT